MGRPTDSTEGRIPPHDVNAEAAVLSGCMIDGNALEEVAAFLRPPHFFSETHRRMFEAMLALREAGDPVDVVTVGTYLRDRQRLEQCGGMQYLTEILNAVPALSNVEVYARAVLEKSQVRRVIAKAQETAARGYVDYGEARAFLAEVEHDFAEIAGTLAIRDRGIAMPALMKGFYEQLVHAAKTGRPPGIEMGFSELDEKMLGLHRGDLTVIAARPGMGKTAFVLALAENVAAKPPQLYADDGKPGQRQGVCFFSLEMPKEQLAARMIASHGRYDMQRLRAANIHAGDWAGIAASASFLAGLPIHIDDTPGLSLDEIRAVVRRQRGEMARKGVRLSTVIIDYLQLMKGNGSERSREQEISSISRGLKGVAKQEEVALIALSQLNRAVESRTSKRPGITDLRESGAIEQDADNIVFLFRPEYYGESVLPEESGKTELIIAKQRSGPTGTAHARWIPFCARFENM